MFSFPVPMCCMYLVCVDGHWGMSHCRYLMKIFGEDIWWRYLVKIFGKYIWVLQVFHDLRRDVSVWFARSLRLLSVLHRSWDLMHIQKDLNLPNFCVFLTIYTSTLRCSMLSSSLATRNTLDHLSRFRTKQVLQSGYRLVTGARRVWGSPDESNSYLVSAVAHG